MPAIFRRKEATHMAYEGWLVKIGRTPSADGYKIPLKYIRAESYSAYVNMQDVDPWTDADGWLHRNAVEMKALKVEFETPAMLDNRQLSELMRNIRMNYATEKARQMWVQAYIPEYDGYCEPQVGYLADFQPQMYYADRELKEGEKVIRYNPIRLSFIGGVYPG